MENSDVVSMSESSTMDTSGKKKDKDLKAELQLQKKKIKVLKQALKDEKVATENT